MKKIRTLGILLGSAVTFQIISAYLLYYLSNEVVREWFANLHAAVGFLLPIVLTVHILHVIKLRKKAKKLAMSF